MELSSSLVKKFVNAVQEPAARIGYYTYGTAIVNGDHKYVQLDGSDGVTSVSVATDLETGDRVMVYIEDHVASVVGNITCPASGRGAVDVSSMLQDFESLVVGDLYAINANIEAIYTNYVTTEYLEANYILADYITANYLLADTASLTYATIENLVALDAKINEIVANSITVDYLEANYANLTDLEAVRGRIAELEANQITVDYLMANYATIEQLEAAYGYIYELDSEYARIASLLAGTAGVGELDAIHLTADNVVIDDAVIKSAMIESISADKITAGTIYTSLVKIQTAESDTSLYLNDSLIQMSDDDRVRMQMGKDATGEYNLYIWNAEGNLMFDATGATADGIGEEVIVNTHVADDAMIAGYKLDIASVARELNDDGSLTVNAAQVFIDDTTLDYKLTEINDQITNISFEGLQAVKLYFAIGNSCTEPPLLPDEIVPALTDVALTDLSYTDLYDMYGIWSTEQPQAGEGEYVWIIYYLEYENGNAIWSEPMCLTDGFVREQTTYISTQLEVINGSITGKVWMTDIEEALDTTISELWGEINVALGEVSLEVGEIIYSLDDLYVKKASLVLQLDEETHIATMSALADVIQLTASQIIIESDNFSLKDGVLYAVDAYLEGTINSNSGVIGGWTIGASAIYNGTSSMSSTTSGTYIGQSGIRQYASSSTYVNITGGVLTAYGAIINGTITASSGVIGGWTIGASAIYNGTSSMSSTTSGTYIGQSGIRQYASGGSYLNITSSKIENGTSDAKTILEDACLKFYYNNKLYANIYISNANASLNFETTEWFYFGGHIEIGDISSTSTEYIMTANKYASMRLACSSNGNYGLYDPIYNTWLIRFDSSQKIYIGDSNRGDTTIGGILYVPNKGVAIANAYGVYHYLANGSDFKKFEYLDSSNYFHVGNGSYWTFLVGSHMHIYPGTSFSTSSAGMTFYIHSTNSTSTSSTSDNTIILCGGCDSTSPFIRSYATYARTGSSSANVHITSSGIFDTYSSSSARYKNSINYITNAEYASEAGLAKSVKVLSELDWTEDMKSILNLPVVKFHFNEGYISGEPDYDYDQYVTGFIAEDVEKICPECASYTEDGVVEAWDYMKMIPRIVYVVQKNYYNLDSLTMRIDKTESEIESLRSQLEEANNKIAELEKQLAA